MVDLLSLSCVIAAIILLIALSAIDLKHLILPDELNFALGITGIAFHLLTAYRFLELQHMLIGAAIGGGLLYTIRFFANKYYGRDTLGLGDVKLMIAAGLWLGIEGTLQATTVGAFAGLLHGLVYASYVSLKNKTAFSIRNLSIPAGPGFAAGIIFAGYIMFAAFAQEIIHDILS